MDRRSLNLLMHCHVQLKLTANISNHPQENPKMNFNFHCNCSPFLLPVTRFMSIANKNSWLLCSTFIQHEIERRHNSHIIDIFIHLPRNGARTIFTYPWPTFQLKNSIFRLVFNTMIKCVYIGIVLGNKLLQMDRK